MTSIGRSAFPLFASLLLSSAAFAVDLQDGAVYVMTNQPTNEIVIFDRLGNGTLERVRTSQDWRPRRSVYGRFTSRRRTRWRHKAPWRLVSVAAFCSRSTPAATKSPCLASVIRDSRSSIECPREAHVRSALRRAENLLYVLNEGGTPGVTAFTIDGDGDLTRLAQSTRSLPRGDFADPAQVSFTPDGERLVITAKRTNLIGTLRVRPDGRTGTLIITPSSGLTPFGFGFARGRLIVSEAAAGVDGESSVSSYAVSDGGLEVISGAVPDFGTAACWIVVTGNGRYAYTSNTGSGQVSSYRVRDDGTLALLDATASNTSDTSLPIDMSRSSDSRYLYVHLAGQRAVAVFRIQANGALTRLQTIGGLPRGAQGIAAR